VSGIHHLLSSSRAGNSISSTRWDSNSLVVKKKFELGRALACSTTIPVGRIVQFSSLAIKYEPEALRGESWDHPAPPLPTPPPASSSPLQRLTHPASRLNARRVELERRWRVFLRCHSTASTNTIARIRNETCR